MADVWEQLPAEPDAAFTAFLVYRDMRPPRAVLAAYRTWKKDAMIKRATGRWQQYAKDHRWAERANAYDLHIDKIRRGAKEQAVAEVTEQRVREIEMSALNTLKETAALAHSNIADIMEWDEDGVRLKASKELPPHVTAAISKVAVSHDRLGNANVLVEMHPKVRPIDLLGQYYSLWEDEKKQAQKAQTNAFLDFLTFLKSDAFKEIAEQGPIPDLQHPPPEITVTIEGQVVHGPGKKV